ncbi:ABC transporter substrate-binding protein [Solirubrobacter phytolaccae]|uniref:ABC transporter substrate-binding protein n=1 Tax=Solirubrobacter phytolaccae TaxID=1404360 RepID=A0A9X3N8N9_9ACTN|nr:ABC transporter substrate-binding protein [Solirubrobacter phytolaccae]MDA0180465.1 ABC transporter substrate-binding protein [Solirubrobacter phytolaccae]
MYRLGGAGLAGALAALVVGCGGGGSSPAAPARTVPPGGGFKPGNVTFGVLAPLETARGQEVRQGAELAAADLDVRGGVLGQRVKIVAEDDGCTAGGGEAAALKLRAVAAGVVGGVCEDAAKAAARAMDGVPLLITSANAPGVVSAKRTPTAYLTNGTPYQSALAAVHWLAYSRAQKLAVLTDDDRASAALGKEVLGLSAPVPKPVSEQVVEDVDVSVKATLAAKPDTVYWAGAPARGGELLAALRDAGFDGTFVASAASESPEFIAAAGAAADGAYVIAPASPQNLPEAADFTARFKAKFGREPGSDALQAYEGVRALAQAVTQSGKVEPERNATELTQLDPSFETLLGGELAFASDHTVKYDNNLVLRVDGTAFVVENTLRSDG